MGMEAQGRNDFVKAVDGVMDSIREMLIDKNKKYGNSALEPVRIFSKADATEQIRVRIDDKIKRIQNEQINDDEDVVSDLIGYLVLYKIAKNKQNGIPN